MGFALPLTAKCGALRIRRRYFKFLPLAHQGLPTGPPDSGRAVVDGPLWRPASPCTLCSALPLRQFSPLFSFLSVYTSPPSVLLTSLAAFKPTLWLPVYTSGSSLLWTPDLLIQCPNQHSTWRSWVAPNFRSFHPHSSGCSVILTTCPHLRPSNTSNSKSCSLYLQNNSGVLRPRPSLLPPQGKMPSPHLDKCSGFSLISLPSTLPLTWKPYCTTSRLRGKTGDPCIDLWTSVASSCLPDLSFSHVDHLVVSGIQGTFPPQSRCTSGPLCLELFFLSTCFIVSSL